MQFYNKTVELTKSSKVKTVKAESTHIHPHRAGPRTTLQIHVYQYAVTVAVDDDRYGEMSCPLLKATRGVSEKRLGTAEKGGPTS